MHHDYHHPTTPTQKKKVTPTKMSSPFSGAKKCLGSSNWSHFYRYGQIHVVFNQLKLGTQVGPTKRCQKTPKLCRFHKYWTTRSPNLKKKVALSTWWKFSPGEKRSLIFPYPKSWYFWVNDFSFFSRLVGYVIVSWAFSIRMKIPIFLKWNQPPLCIAAYFSSTRRE